MDNIRNKLLIGGVSNGWNSFSVYGPTIVSKTEGVYLWDNNNKKYIDYCMGWGSHFLGNTPEFAKRAFELAYSKGFGIQYETDFQLLLAQKINQYIPSMEKIRFTNTGTESTMQAIKIARAYTGRDKIIKFEGHFHGVNDYLNFGNDASLLGDKEDGIITSLPGSSGIPKEMSKYIEIIEYNDLETFKKVLSNSDIAGVILEPVCLASAIMYPQDSFLTEIRKLCDMYGIVLIFDEVMSGFRSNLGGAQKDFEIKPDITVLSKILGCGFPISAIGGKTEILSVVDPIGDCVISGTNNGRLLNVMGALLALEELEMHPEYYSHLHRLSEYFIKKSNELLIQYGVNGVVKGYAGRIVIHFGTTKLGDNFRSSVSGWDREFHNKMYKYCYENGLYGFLLPLKYCPEPICITPKHTFDDIDQTLEIFENGLKLYCKNNV
ncbi:TPA: aminotransferase class III-fold pyridoxal phosphate-dependent enzyme [Streptococcus suis]|nr:aminotransferase class III-fold pyridoxal phosphate-dependent enzyme [Streptococcus suis]